MHHDGFPNQNLFPQLTRAFEIVSASTWYLIVQLVLYSQNVNESFNNGSKSQKQKEEVSAIFCDTSRPCFRLVI